MLIRLAVLADAANLAADGKLNILGEFNVLRARAFPTTWGRLFIVVKLEADPGEGRSHPIAIRVVDADTQPIGPTTRGTIDFGRRYSPGIPHQGPLIIEIRNAMFPRAGTYEFQIEVGAPSLAVARIPLYVFAVEDEQSSEQE